MRPSPTANIARPIQPAPDPYRLIRARIVITDRMTGTPTAEILQTDGSTTGITCFADIMEGWRNGCRFTHAGGAQYLCRVDQRDAAGVGLMGLKLIPVSYLTGGSVIKEAACVTGGFQLCTGVSSTRLTTTIAGTAYDDILSSSVYLGGGAGTFDCIQRIRQASGPYPAIFAATSLAHDLLNGPRMMTASRDLQSGTTTISHINRSIDQFEPFELDLACTYSASSGGIEYETLLNVRIMASMTNAGTWDFDYQGTGSESTRSIALSEVTRVTNYLLAGGSTGASLSFNFTAALSSRTVTITPTASAAPAIRTTGITITTSVGSWKSTLTGGA